MITKEEITSLINKHLCGKKLEKMKLSYDDICGVDEIWLYFENNHALRITVPLGHTFDDIDIEVTNGAGWLNQ